MTAQLVPVDIVAPGGRGVNFEEDRNILPGSWATEAHNCTINPDGLLAAREGYSDVTSTAVTGNLAIKALFEYVGEDEDRQILVAWDDAGGAGIANSIDDPEGNIIDGSVVVTSGDWWFQNGWDNCFGFVDGQKPVIYSGSGTFATVTESSGTAPTIADGVGLVAFGRVWGLDADKQIIKFSALLNSAHWSTGAGVIDMSFIWTNGTDHVTAIIAMGNSLVVFGHHHIVFWVDGTGNQLGINPDNLYVSDIIEGVGCESQWSIQQIGEADVFFVSSHGIQSLKRVVETGAGAGVNSLSLKVSTKFLADLNNTSNKSTIRSVVDPVRGIYIVSFPGQDRSWVVHYTKPFQDERSGKVLFPITTWDLAPTSLLWDVGNTRLLLSDASNPGNVGLYGGLRDDVGTDFTLRFLGPWLDLGEQFANRLKILKRIGALLFMSSQASVNFTWEFDFTGRLSTKVVEWPATGAADWGVGEWGTAEWGGGGGLRIVKFAATGTGQYIRLGITLTITNSFYIQQIELLSKLGIYA